MFTLQRIAVLSLLALITGCTEHLDCKGPGFPKFDNCPDNFLLKVKAIDAATGLVTVTVSDRVPGVRERSEKDPAFAKRIQTPYKVRVRDLSTLIESGRLVVDETYAFHNGNGSPYLEVFDKGNELDIPHEG